VSNRSHCRAFLFPRRTCPPCTTHRLCGLLNYRLVAFLATELVAATTTIAIQSSVGATPKEVLVGAGSVVGALGVLWVLVRVLVRPMLHNWFYAVLESEAARTTQVIVESFDKNDRTRAMTRGFMDRLYADKIARDTETRDIAEANRDRLVFLEESQGRMGEVLAKDMAAAVRDFTRSNEQQTNVMRDMQKEMRALSEAYARLDERFNAIYDGPERRQKPR
jgi:hypothetical protein